MSAKHAIRSSKSSFTSNTALASLRVLASSLFAASALLAGCIDDGGDEPVATGFGTVGGDSVRPPDDTLKPTDPGDLEGDPSDDGTWDGTLDTHEVATDGTTDVIDPRHPADPFDVEVDGIDDASDPASARAHADLDYTK